MSSSSSGPSGDSPTGPYPRSRQVSQSCGRATAATRAAASGSASRSQRSFVAVNDATGTTPVRRAYSSAPTSSIRSRAACAERVSFQSRASRMTRPSASSTTMPCCCPPTEIASTPSSPPASANAESSAPHHAAGSTSVPSGCGARPVRTSAPVATSRITTLHDCVDESTRRRVSSAVPVSRAAPSRCSVASCCRRTKPKPLPPRYASESKSS